jgi:hypothetical protein
MGIGQEGEAEFIFITGQGRNRPAQPRPGPARGEAKSQVAQKIPAFNHGNLRLKIPPPPRPLSPGKEDFFVGVNSRVKD